METEQPTEVLQTALGMLDKIPKSNNSNGSSAGGASLMVDVENSHVIQGLVMGVAYLLKHLHDRHCGNNNSTTNGAAGGTGKSKKSKKQEAKNKQQLQSGICDAIEKFLKTIGSS